MKQPLLEAKKIYNLFLGFIAYNYKIKKSINSHTTLLIETTNNCNLKCAICPRRVMKRAVNNMDHNLFKKIIAETKPYTRFIWLHGMGEPLMDPLLEQRIVHCKKNNIKAGISTNAALLTKKRSEALIKAGLDRIILCLDGVKKETYEKIRVNAEFEKTVANIKNFLELKKTLKSDIYVMLQIIYTDETKKEISKFKETWNDYPINEIVIKKFNTWGDQTEGIKELSKPELYYPASNIKKRPACYYLWHSFVILSDGRVVPCCRDYDAKIVLGDLNNQSLEEIWNSKILKKIREDQINGKFNNGLCNNCLEYPPIKPTKLILSINNIKRGIRHLKRGSVG
jgi:radical SAM protein with 4Fe4S-binding SPASM domain